MGNRTLTTPPDQHKRCHFYNRVEVIGRYSNPPSTPVDLHRLLTTIPPDKDLEVVDRPPRQHQRRLRPEELLSLTADYVEGVEVIELAKRYGITRQTVLVYMRRLGVPRRHPRLGPDTANQAADLYLVGNSLAVVGNILGVDPGTVRRALLKDGVSIRDPQGRPR